MKPSFVKILTSYTIHALTYPVTVKESPNHFMGNKMGTLHARNIDEKLYNTFNS